MSISSLIPIILCHHHPPPTRCDFDSEDQRLEAFELIVDVEGRVGTGNDSSDGSIGKVQFTFNLLLHWGGLGRLLLLLSFDRDICFPHINI